MPKYPLSSNLLALLSGSFYGTADPRQERKARRTARRRVEARRDEKDEKKPGEVGRGETRRKKRGREGGGGVPKWRSKPRDKISLCVRTEAHTGARGNGSRRLGLIFRESRYHILLLPPPPPSPLPSSFILLSYLAKVSYLAKEDLKESLIFCYLAFSDPPPISIAQLFQSTTALQC